MIPFLPLRLFIPLLLVAFVTMVSLVSFIYMSSQAERKVEEKASYDTLQTMNMLQSSINIMLRRDDFEAAKIQLTSLITNPQISLAIIVDEHGEIILSTHQRAVVEALDERVASFLHKNNFSDLTGHYRNEIFLSDNRQSVRAVSPISLPGGNNGLRITQNGFLILEKSIQWEKGEAQRNVEFTVLMFFGFMFVVSVITWWILNNLITRRAMDLSAMSDQVGQGNLSIRSALTGNDEFSHIGDAFNNMVVAFAQQRDELSSSEQRLKQSQAFSQMGSWQWMIATDQLYWSETVAPMFDLPVDVEVNYDLFVNCIHPDDRDLVNQSIQTCLDENTALDVQHRIMHEDGSIRWVHESGDVIRDASGAPLQMCGMVRDVTEQRDAEEHLLALVKELKFQQFAIDQHAIVTTTDWAGEIIYTNDKFNEVSGYSGQEVIGETHRIINSGYHPEAFFTELWTTICAGKVWQGEICDRNKSGELYWIDTTIVPHLDKYGKPDRFTSISYEVTERVLAQQVVEDEQALLETMNSIQSKFLLFTYPLLGFKNSLSSVLALTGSQYAFIAEVLYTADGDPYFKTLSDLSWNPETHALYDKRLLPKQEFYKHDSIFGAAIRSSTGLFSNAPCSEWGAESSELQSSHIFNVMAVPLLNSEKVIGVLGLANRPQGYDESLMKRFNHLATTFARVIDAYQIDKQRRLVEVDLARFKSTVDVATDAIYMFHPESLKFFYLNESAIDQAGYSRQEMFTMTPLDINPDFNEVSFNNMIQSLIKEPNKSVTFETIQRHKEGGLISVEVFLQYIAPSNEPARFVTFVRDITERLQIQKQLQQSQKMEAIGQLTAGIAHDFNNMLASILGFTRLAQRRIMNEDQPKLSEYLGEVTLAGNRARDLVRQLLDFSRAHAGLAEPVNVVPLIKEITKLFQSTLPANIQLHYKVEENMPNILMDQVQLHQILLNMIVNARDAITEHGQINIQTQTVSYAAKENMQHKVCDACNHAIEPGRYVEISIRDSGSGIELDTMNQIFEPFFTTKEVGKGTGLGLSTVLGIMHQHKGHIVVHSEPGCGSTFKLIFPADDSGLLDDGDDDFETSLMPESLYQYHILVVDDERALALLMGEILNGFGAEAVIMTDSQEALDLFRDKPDSFDLVITDQTMPKLTGKEIAVEMLKVRPELPIILCSGYSGELDEEEIKALGVRGFLGKPLHAGKLIDMLTVLLNVEP